MAVPRTCCQPCNRQGWCSVKTNCCVECHFSWEEEVAAPYLPPPLRRQLIEEHRALEAAGFPRDAVLRHAEWEEGLFQQYCPQEVYDQAVVDHEDYEQGHLKKRDV